MTKKSEKTEDLLVFKDLIARRKRSSRENSRPKPGSATEAQKETRRKATKSGQVWNLKMKVLEDNPDD